MSTQLEIEDLLVFQNDKKSLLYIFGSFVFVIIGLWMLIAEDLILFRIIGVVCFLYFGLCTVLYVVKLFSKKPMLVVNEKGITDNTGATSLGFMPWTDIKEIKMISKARSIEVVLFDEEKYLSRLSPIKRIFTDNRKWGLGIALIRFNTMGVEFEKAILQMQALLKKYKTETEDKHIIE